MEERKLILHRGYKGKYPENSFISFEMALKEGKNFETDIRVSKDKVCFMAHDDTIGRILDGAGRVSELLSKEIKSFHYKEDVTQDLCSLKELCTLIEKTKNKNSLVFIHIKKIEDIGPVITEIGKYNLQDRIRVFAVDEIEEDFRRIMKGEYPTFQIGLYLPENSENFNAEKFEQVGFIWVDEITIPWITKEKVELAHSLGKPFYAISPELIPESIFNKDVEKRWKELLEMNVDGICTDLPGRLIKFLKIKE